MASGVKNKRTKTFILRENNNFTIGPIVQANGIFKLWENKKMLYNFQATAVEHKQHCITVKDKQSMSKFYNS